VWKYFDGVSIVEETRVDRANCAVLDETNFFRLEFGQRIDGGASRFASGALYCPPEIYQCDQESAGLKERDRKGLAHNLKRRRNNESARIFRSTWRINKTEQAVDEYMGAAIVAKPTERPPYRIGEWERGAHASTKMGTVQVMHSNVWTIKFRR
jgi:hypothetical protein